MDRFEILRQPWIAPQIPEDIPHGDMPGDKVCIGEGHIAKANVIFPQLCKLLAETIENQPAHRAVIAVCGGSGVGKSETASLLGYYLNALGIGSYTMSGDNYPRRIPRDNDAERLRIYRAGGLRGLVASGVHTKEIGETLRLLWEKDTDADPAMAAEHPWLAVYQKAAARSLNAYLGTENEIDFDEVSSIIARFKQGAKSLHLKRMGRETTTLWYDEVDMTEVNVLIIEWTHGNSDYIEGVDIPILLNSTPAETLAHRRARNRDGQTDSAFTTTVLALEQKKLENQAHKAKIIVAKSGELLTYGEYRRMMAEA